MPLFRGGSEHENRFAMGSRYRVSIGGIRGKRRGGKGGREGGREEENLRGRREPSEE